MHTWLRRFSNGRIRLRARAASAKVAEADAAGITAMDAVVRLMPRGLRVLLALRALLQVVMAVAELDAEARAVVAMLLPPVPRSTSMRPIKRLSISLSPANRAIPVAVLSLLWFSHRARIAWNA